MEILPKDLAASHTAYNVSGYEASRSLQNKQAPREGNWRVSHGKHVDTWTFNEFHGGSLEKDKGADNS